MIDSPIHSAKRLLRRFDTLATALRRLRDVRRLRHSPQPTPMGFRFAGDAMMQAGTFEPDETRLVKRLLPDADVFIDVGANVGYYVCHALQAGKEVVAFEPMDVNVRLLLRNLEANAWQDCVEVFPLAVGAAPGIVRIYGAGSGASTVMGWAGVPEKDVRLVPASSLDRVLGARFAGRRCLVVVDVEGAERAVLQGATALLHATPKPAWLVEISIDEHQPKGRRINPHLAETFRMFWEAGYEAWTADRAPRLVTPADVERVAATETNSFATHNFLFVEAGAGARLLPPGEPDAH
jgi:FkbM family methyltransferase